MDLSIIIVSYRGWKSLSECLDELAAYNSKGFEFEVIIADNNSGDNVFRTLRKKYPAHFRFFENTKNGGFANGCNLGALNARGDYMLFLNPDTVAPEISVGSLLERAKKNAEYSVLSCRQINSNGRESRAYGSFPTPLTLTGPGRAVARLVKGRKIKPEISGINILPDWVSGSVLMIGRRLYEELGGFDEAYWMYYEDMDLCRRVRYNSGGIVYFTDITIKHNHGGSSRINAATTALTKTEVMISRHVYIQKHFSGISRLVSHSYLVFFNLFSLFPGAIGGILLFFIPKLHVRTLIFLRTAGYYFYAAKRASWISPRSVAKNVKNI